MLKYILNAVLAFYLLSNPTKAEAVDVHFFMSDIAGMSMNDDRNKGMGRTIVEMALEKSGLSYSIEFLPWTRLHKKFEKDPKALMLPLARTREREAKYSWLKQIFKAEIGFVSSRHAVNDLEEARDAKQVAVWRDTFFEKHLVNKGFNNIARFEGDERLGKLFDSGRVQIWFGELNETRYRLKQYYQKLTHPLQVLYFGKPVVAMDVWLVANPEFDQDKRNRLVKALDEIYATGYQHELFARYYHLTDLPEKY